MGKVKEQSQAFCNMLKKCLAELCSGSRKGQGISIRKLHELSGVSTTVISDFENQDYLPSIDVIMRIVYALNISLEDLFKKVSVLFNITAQTDDIKTIDLALASLGLRKEVTEEVISFIQFKQLQTKGKLPDLPEFIEMRKIMKSMK